MSYLSFLLTFILSANILLFLLLQKRKRGAKYDSPIQWNHRNRRLLFILLFIIIILYTTPWDSFLIHKGVWNYHRNQVIGITVYGVPIEEITFYILQTILILQWFTLIQFNIPVLHPQMYSKWKTRLASIIIWVFWFGIAITLYFVLNHRLSSHLTYLSLLGSWALFPLGIQMLYNAKLLLANSKLLFWVIFPPTLYLSVCDSVAIHQGIWYFHQSRILDLTVYGVPIEEIIFFLLTNTLVSWSAILVWPKEKSIPPRNVKILTAFSDAPHK
ncbi:lycopene cyclase domain-containing protein [Alicyclobacillus tolerans]|uniref:Putative membrane protein n=1 Tax=Alicyclobacillus tolerans TaxID=90970 RepID=A0A1M6QRV0_9BACL|nr:lycopene cyclase domain-containing protein [Alicyclobacillus montanus]SHK23039.1 putative membrane protein [Alicyclobacillus montanus]